MIKKEMTRGYNKYTLEYDDSRFDIKYCKFSHSFVLTTKDGIVLSVFPRSIGFIKQVEIKGKIHFIVSNRTGKDGLSKFNSLEIFSFIISPLPTLEVLDSSNIHSINYEDVVLDDSTVLIACKDGYSVYSLKEDLTSREYKSVIKDDRFRDITGTNIIVEELIAVNLYKNIPDIYDVITYGIDPVTLRIKTKIFSKNQNKYIDLYTKEQVLETQITQTPLVRNYLKTEVKDEIGTTTIINEIIKPLEEQAKYKCFILSDVTNDQEKISFIKSLGSKDI